MARHLISSIKTLLRGDEMTRFITIKWRMSLGNRFLRTGRLASAGRCIPPRPRCPSLLPNSFDGSFPSQACDDRGKFLHLYAAVHGNGGKPVAFSLLKQMLHRLLDAHRDPGKRWPLFLGLAVSLLLSDGDDIGQLAQFQVRKARTSRFSHPCQLLFQQRIRPIDVLGRDPEHERNAVGLAGRKGEHPLPRAPDQNGRMRLLDWPREAFHPADRIVLPRESDALLSKQALENGQALLQAAHACARILKGHAQLLVIPWADPCSQAQFKASTRQHIQRRHFLRQQRRVPVIITEDTTANTQRGGGLRRHGQCREGCKASDRAIWDDQARIAQFLGGSSQRHPRGMRRGTSCHYSKTKWLGHRTRSPLFFSRNSS